MTPRVRRRCLLSACLLLGPVIAPALAAPPAAPLVLDNGHVRLEATDAFGGRVLAWHLVGEPNVLKVGDAVHTQPRPTLSPQAGDIAYLGHDVWVGPQSGWWLHQDANPARRAAAANWPPDPYLSLARTRIVARDGQHFVLEGVDSPVTGVRLHKTVRLDPAAPDSVLFEAQARNIRDSPIAWDLWFNTRVAANTRVFVPVADATTDVDLKPTGEAGTTAPRHAWAAGLFELTAHPGDDALIQRGKYRIQPAAGWLAGFAGHQLLLIRFAHQPRERIHPEQGQVELYLDAASRAPADGLMELEVHAPYRQLAPGEQMQAGERWTLLRYDGPDQPAAQRDFLCRQAAQLGLDHACGS